MQLFFCSAKITLYSRSYQNNFSVLLCYLKILNMNIILKILFIYIYIYIYIIKRVGLLD